jgi:hypothetical protein
MVSEQLFSLISLAKPEDRPEFVEICDLLEVERPDIDPSLLQPMLNSYKSFRENSVNTQDSEYVTTPNFPEEKKVEEPVPEQKQEPTQSYSAFYTMDSEYAMTPNQRRQSEKPIQLASSYASLYKTSDTQHGSPSKQDPTSQLHKKKKGSKADKNPKSGKEEE